MDMPDQPWQRRFRPRPPKIEQILAADDTRPLVECEPGHFVADENNL
jgi:hypothetical protein